MTEIFVLDDHAAFPENLGTILMTAKQGVTEQLSNFLLRRGTYHKFLTGLVYICFIFRIGWDKEG